MDTMDHGSQAEFFEDAFLDVARAATTHFKGKEGARPPRFELHAEAVGLHYPPDAVLALIRKLLKHFDDVGYVVPFRSAWENAAVTVDGLVDIPVVVAAFPVSSKHPFANPDGTRLAGSMHCLAGIVGALGVHRQPFLFVDVHPRDDKWNAGMGEGTKALDDELIARTCKLLLAIPFAQPFLVFGAHARDGLINASECASPAGWDRKVPEWRKSLASHLANGNGAVFFRHPVCVHPGGGEHAIAEAKIMDLRARKGGGVLAYSIEALTQLEVEQLQGTSFEDVFRLAIVLRFVEKEEKEIFDLCDLPECLQPVIQKELVPIQARIKKEPGCSHLRALLSVWGKRGGNVMVDFDGAKVSASEKGGRMTAKHRDEVLAKQSRGEELNDDEKKILGILTIAGAAGGAARAKRHKEILAKQSRGEELDEEEKKIEKGMAASYAALANANKRRKDAAAARRTGAARTGAARTGAARTGAARTGAARIGAARIGAARIGAARIGATAKKRKEISEKQGSGQELNAEKQGRGEELDAEERKLLEEKAASNAALAAADKQQGLFPPTPPTTDRGKEEGKGGEKGKGEERGRGREREGKGEETSDVELLRQFEELCGLIALNNGNDNGGAAAGEGDGERESVIALNAIDGSSRQVSKAELSELYRMTDAQFTARQAMLNRSKSKPIGASGFRGVYRPRHNIKWLAQANQGGCMVHIGTFETKREAARAHDRFVLAHRGRNALLNFHPRNYLYPDGYLLPAEGEQISVSQRTDMSPPEGGKGKGEGERKGGKEGKEGKEPSTRGVDALAENPGVSQILKVQREQAQQAEAKAREQEREREAERLLEQIRFECALLARERARKDAEEQDAAAGANRREVRHATRVQGPSGAAKMPRRPGKDAAAARRTGAAGTGAKAKKSDMKEKLENQGPPVHMPSEGDYNGTGQEELSEFQKNRKRCLERYREKKRKGNFCKKVRYPLKKIETDKKPRYKGQFIKKDEGRGEELDDAEKKIE